MYLRCDVPRNSHDHDEDIKPHTKLTLSGEISAEL
jgi:hypothetical protein